MQLLDHRMSSFLDINDAVIRNLGTYIVITLRYKAQISIYIYLSYALGCLLHSRDIFG